MYGRDIMCGQIAAGQRNGSLYILTHEEDDL